MRTGVHRMFSVLRRINKAYGFRGMGTSRIQRAPDPEILWEKNTGSYEWC